MPETKEPIPMLRGFLTGEPISDHHGVSCSPAMREATEEKYILKTVSVPASGEKLEAMLLAGAFSDKEAALAYYKNMAQDIVDEAVLLQRLSRLGGFIPFDNWQSHPKEDGHCVYLLSPYRLTLERYLKTNTMTHLDAVNLGLDLCSALAVARRSGFLYVDLKPGNIFISDDRGFHIGDLGFLSLASLQYASLPEKYHSPYTAPEIQDAYSALNDTLDIYALGLTLYQVYNNGLLPQLENGTLPPPEYADYEMAAIILKACDLDPANRWTDPAQMGQALVSYMQKNTVNDTPIIPPALPVEVEPEPELVEDPIEPQDPTTDEVLNEVDQALESVGVDTETAEPQAEPAGEESQDEPAPAEDEVSQMLAQADELIAHETPEGVVAPEAIDVPIPPPIVLTPETAEEEPVQEPEPAPEAPEEEPEAPAPIPAPEEPPEEERPQEEPPRRGWAKAIIAAAICVVVAASLFLGGYLYYNYEYLQHIGGITLTGEEDRLTVSLDTQIEDALLTVVCTDSYGNTKRQKVTNGTAIFTDLSPNTRYKVQVEISGFHQLTGNTGSIHNTQAQTSILNFSAVAGGESGSVILSFTAQGPEAEGWKVTYTAEGENEKSVTFTGHVVTVTGLTLGKEYAFRLEPTQKLYLVGENTLTFTLSNLIFAENLTIQSFTGNVLTAVWNTPAGETVDNWIVRCFNENGFDKTVTVSGTQAVFEGLDPAYGYTVEVSAAGMSQGSRAHISANSLTIKEFTAVTTDPTRLVLSWTFEGQAPEGGWMVLYTVSGVKEQQSIQCAENQATILPMLPGSTYSFTIQAVGGNTVFGGSFECTAPEAKTFSGYDVEAKHFKFSMCLTPSNADWDRGDVAKKDYTTEFNLGQSASFVMKLSHEYDTSSDEIVTAFILRDAEGTVISMDTVTAKWRDMWYKGYGTLTLPTMPQTAGSYTVEILMNGQRVTTESFTVV